MADEQEQKTGLEQFQATPQPPAPRVEDIPDELPVLPISNNVIFPATITPVAIGKPVSLAAVEAAMTSNKLIAAVAMRPASETAQGEQSEESPERLFDHGTVCLILKLLRMPDGTMRILVQGLRKARVERIVQGEPHIRARFALIEESVERTSELEALMRNMVEMINRIVSMASYLPDDLRSAATSIDDPLMLVYLVATLFRLKIDEKQRILEIEDVAEKYRTLLRVLNREVEILEIGGKIKEDVQAEIGKSQRDYYLREQLKAIQHELGETDETQAEVEELATRIAALDLPDEVHTEADRELKRLRRIPPISPEHQMIRTFLDWIIELPWRVSTDDDLDLKRARRILDEDHYGLEQIKDRIVEYLAVRGLKHDAHGPILCFVGPPGTGKTSLGQSIARALGRNFIRMSLGGMHDEAEIRGHRRTYIGAMPGRILQSIRRAASNNPVMMLDEMDKIGADFRGDPSSALLEVLDPAQNTTFRDHYLGLAFDLSKVLFIGTANMLDTIQPALRDRMEIIRLSGYTTEEKIAIAERYLVRRQVKDNGLDESRIEFQTGAIERIVTDYTREAGVRNLEREIGTVCRKVAYRFASDGGKKVTVTAGSVPDYLGPQKVFIEVGLRTAVPGVATGLAWTEAGGDVLFVEATKMPGGKSLQLTGQLGGVMQESARAALSCVRSRAEHIGLAPDFYDKCDLHLHVPAGAIPKDGPSAGVVMATALVSCVSGVPVSEKVAMTGEITLTGVVLPVGGIKEKVLAAKRAGVTKIVVPARNEQDVNEIPAQLREGLEFVYVEDLDQVLETAFNGHLPRKHPKRRAHDTSHLVQHPPTA
ncbi:MAG: endopeptidase La [Verrucomicrobia bacterium]|nr:endopeptidase La [Verrucomicrobiota bacterium]